MCVLEVSNCHLSTVYMQIPDFEIVSTIFNNSLSDFRFKYSLVVLVKPQKIRNNHFYSTFPQIVYIYLFFNHIYDFQRYMYFLLYILFMQENLSKIFFLQCCYGEFLIDMHLEFYIFAEFTRCFYTLVLEIKGPTCLTHMIEMVSIKRDCCRFLFKVGNDT